jgi:glycerate kinase
LKVIVAPNAFKGSVSAQKIADLLVEGMSRSNLKANYIKFPIADGGDGTMSLLTEFLEGEVHYKQVNDPIGRSILAPFGYVEKQSLAIIEMASASGIALLKDSELNPLNASSFGTGQLINDAINMGAKRIVLTIGGSATIDGGIGILTALGLEVIDAQGQELKPNGKSLHKISKIKTERFYKTIQGVEFTLLCDVDNPLLGKDGAAAVFGPQKGANPEQIQLLEAGLDHFASCTEIILGKNVRNLKHGGAAGGAGAFLQMFLLAEVIDGASYLMEQMNFEKHLNGASLLITGEGRIDSQTRQGKGPYFVAERAKKSGLKVIAIAGQIDSGFDAREYPAFDVVIPIGSGPMTLSEALAKSEDNIVRVGQLIGDMLCLTEQG